MIYLTNLINFEQLFLQVTCIWLNMIILIWDSNSFALIANDNTVSEEQGASSNDASNVEDNDENQEESNNDGNDGSIGLTLFVQNYGCHSSERNEFEPINHINITKNK